MVRTAARVRALPTAAEVTLHNALSSAVPRGARLLVAVSGGRDSMVLMDALARWHRSAIVAAATFDHATGDAASSAADLVARTADSLGIPLVRARATIAARTEAGWRAARLGFLRTTARENDARMATAHSRDDQIETVFIRALRGAGARGLAALFAGDDAVRPLLEVPRSIIAAYAANRRLTYVDDPSNRSRAHLRNRVRMDHLPALEAVHPGFGAALLDLARRAAAWRSDVERIARSIGTRCEGRSVFVPAPALLQIDRRAHALLWPVFAARAGIALDRRGTERLVAFSSTGSVDEREGRRVPLAGGHEVIRHPRAFEIRPASQATGGEQPWALHRSSCQ